MLRGYTAFLILSYRTQWFNSRTRSWRVAAASSMLVLIRLDCIEVVAAVADDESVLTQVRIVVDSQNIAGRMAVLHVHADIDGFALVGVPSLTRKFLVALCRFGFADR